MIAIKAWSLIMTFYIEKTKHLVHTVLCVMHLKVCSEYYISLVEHLWSFARLLADPTDSLCSVHVCLN